MKLVARDPMLDWQGLRSRCLGRADLMDKVLGRFHESLQHDLELLERAVDGFDGEQMARWAHRLKGTALTVSATGIQRRAEQFHSLLSDGRDDQARECLIELKAECTSLSEMIAGHLRGAE